MADPFSTIAFPEDDEPGVAPMEARLVDALPAGPGWQYEPKWDGFRCIAYRDGDRVALRSKSGKPLGRFFPEVEDMVRRLRRSRFVIDGELLIARGDALSFAALQARLHPAESRIRRLSVETPARLMLFDCLATDERSLVGAPLDDRREALEALITGERSVLLSPATDRHDVAAAWLERSGGALDGVVAKRRDLSYRAGERAMAKIKTIRTADCVIGGFRLASDGAGVGSLLLGLYDPDGRLNHVGFTSAIAADERAPLLARLTPLIGSPGFTGDAPGGPSRWSSERSSEWQPLRPELVVEVGYDQITDGRFRHGTRLLRWRPDKAPEHCRDDQLVRELRPAELEEVLGVAAPFTGTF